MALISCKECGQQISTKAEACPHCGAKPSRTSLFTMIIAALAVTAMIISFSTPEKNVVAISSSPEEVAQKQKEQYRFQQTAGTAAFVKSHLRNPKSVEWEEIFANEDASVICLSYRAENGFGGMNAEIITFINKIPSQKASIWNDNCVDKSLFDMKFITYALK